MRKNVRNIWLLSIFEEVSGRGRTNIQFFARLCMRFVSYFSRKFLTMILKLMKPYFQRFVITSVGMKKQVRMEKQVFAPLIKGERGIYHSLGTTQTRDVLPQIPRSPFIKGANVASSNISERCWICRSHFLLICAITIFAFTSTFAQTQATISISSNATRSLLPTTIATVSSGASLRALLAEKRVAADIAASIATVRLFTPLPAHGRLFMTGTEAFITIRKQDIQWLDYNGLAEILAAKTPVFPLFLGYQGAYNHLSFLGSSPRDVAVMMNARPVNDIALGAAYIEQLPPEMIEQAEVFIGSDAVILANNAAGAAINLQEIRHDTKDFYTRIWYQQSNEQYTAADVDFSHNIASNLNLTLGARTQFGNRIYNNTGVSAWNARAILRWNVSSSANVSLSYLYTPHRTNLSGGVTSATVLDFNTSATIFNETRESTVRHDLTLTGSTYFTRDSAIAASLTVFGTLNQRTIERGTLQGTLLSGLRGNVSAQADTLIAESTTQTFTVGATGRVETRVTLFSALEAALTAGGTVALSNVQSSVYWDEQLRESAFANRFLSTQGTTQLVNEISGFGRLKLNLLDRVNVSGGARFAILNSRPELAIGARFSTMLVQNTTTTLEFWGDASRSFRTPTLAELGMTTLATLNSESHGLLLAGLRLSEKTAVSKFSCDVLAGYRLIENPISTEQIFVPYPHYFPNISTPENPIVGNSRFRKNDPLIALTNRLPTTRSYNDSTRSILGASVTADWHIRNVLFGGNFIFSGFAQVSVPLGGLSIERFPRRVPLVYAGCTAQYEYVVGRSVLRAGVRVRATTPFQPDSFTPTTWSYSPSSVEQGLTGNGLDIVAGAQVGNAYLRATYQNALSIPAMNVAIYPQYPANVRVTVSLTILE